MHRRALDHCFVLLAIYTAFEVFLKHVPEISAPMAVIGGVLGWVFLMPVTSIFILAPDSVAAVGEIVFHCIVSATGLVLATFLVYKGRWRWLDVPIRFDKVLPVRKARKAAREFLKANGLAGEEIDRWCNETFTTETVMCDVSGACIELLRGRYLEREKAQTV